MEAKYLCPYCGKKLKKNGVPGHIRFNHKEEYERLGWPKIKSQIMEKAVKENIAKIEESEEAEKEIIGDELERPDTMALEWNEDKPYVPQTARTLPSKSLKLDPQVDIYYSYLKANGMIPPEWKIGDFINHYVKEHVNMRDGMRLSVTKSIGGNPNKREVIMMENSLEPKKKDKSPEEEMAELEKSKIRSLKRKQFEEEFGKENMAKVDDGTFDNMYKMFEKITAQRMAMKFADQMFGEDNGKKNTELEALKQQLQQEKEARQSAEIKTAISALADAVKNQKSGKEVGTKDLIQMMMLNQKQSTDFKDTLNQKNMESLMKEHQYINEILVNEMKSIKNKPNIMNQVKEIQDTTKALQNFGVLKGGEKTNQEIVKELVQTSVATLAPAVKSWAEHQGQQQQKPTPSELARMQQIQQQTDQPQMVPEPTPTQAPEQRPIKPEEDEAVIDNLLSQNFGGDGVGGYKNVKKED